MFMYQKIHGNFSVSINSVSINNQYSQFVFVIVTSLILTGFYRYTIRAKSLKVQLSPRYYMSIKDNICKKKIKKIHAYTSYSKKRSVFANKNKKKIHFIQVYLKDMAKRILCINCKYVKEFFIKYVQYVDTLDKFFLIL